MIGTEEMIIHEYIDNKKTVLTLQKEFHADRITIENILFSNGIKLRSRAKDMIGKKFNMLTVMKRLPNQGTTAMYLCKCDCGNTRVCRGVNLRIGRVKDCGCVSQKIRAKHISEHTKLRKHGDSKSNLYAVWCSMKARCFNPADNGFSNYGKRGISVCDNWKNDYISFKKWALESGYKSGLSIERIDVNGNYCPENCKWIPLKEQSYNKTNTRKIFYKNIGQTARQWANLLGCSDVAIYKSAKRHNWNLEHFLTFRNIEITEEMLQNV